MPRRSREARSVESKPRRIAILLDDEGQRTLAKCVTRIQCSRPGEIITVSDVIREALMTMAGETK
jgi:hypothetical protein